MCQPLRLIMWICKIPFTTLRPHKILLTAFIARSIILHIFHPSVDTCLDVIYPFLNLISYNKISAIHLPSILSIDMVGTMVSALCCLILSTSLIFCAWHDYSMTLLWGSTNPYLALKTSTTELGWSMDWTETISVMKIVINAMMKKIVNFHPLQGIMYVLIFLFLSLILIFYCSSA